MKNKKVLSLVLALVMVFGTAVTSFAAQYDIVHKTGDPMYSFTKFAQDSQITKKVGADLQNYLIEYKGKYYNTKDIQDYMDKNPDKALADAVASGIAPQAKPGNYIKVTSDKAKIVANGRDRALITIKVYKGGVVDTDADNMTATVYSTFGKLGKEKVTIQDGEAEVLLTSETLTQPRTAIVRAVITDATDISYINMREEIEVEMDPNPGEVERGAKLADAEAAQADRIILFFDREVKASDYTSSGAAIDPTKARVKLLTSVSATDAEALLPNGKLYDTKDIKGILGVQGNPRALQLLLDVSNQKVLTDNARINLTFTDLTRDKVVGDSGKAVFNLTDARRPELTAVEAKNTAKDAAEVKVTFSEAVYHKDASEIFDAIKLENWAIDGELLSTKGATAAVGDNLKDGDLSTPDHMRDDRNVVTIKLPYNLDGGRHSIQAANIGDWAELTHDMNNRMETQTLDFEVKAWEGTPSTPGAVKPLDVVWIYADKDRMPVELNGFKANTDTEHDYIRVRFNQPLRIDGREFTALSNDNYTVNGQKFPKGTQIIFDQTKPEPTHIDKELQDALAKDPSYLNNGVNSEILIILPEGTVMDPEATVINISEYIEALAKNADGTPIRLGKNADEFKLPYRIIEGTVNPDQAAADAVKNLIDKLVDPATITDPASAAAAEPAAKAARAEFNKLTPAQQALVTNLKKLQDVEAAILAQVPALGEYTLSGIGGVTNIKIYPKAPYTLADVDKVTVNGTITIDKSNAKFKVQADHVRVSVELPKTAIKEVKVSFADGKEGIVKPK